MRTDSLATSKKLGSLSKPGRKAGIFTGFLVSLLGAIILMTSIPAVPAQAASSAKKKEPYIWLSRVDGKFVVQGRHFPAYATGTVQAGISGLKGQKTIHVSKKGYFWVEFYRFDKTKHGKTQAKAWIGKYTKTAKTYFDPVKSGSTGGGVTDKGHKPGTSTGGSGNGGGQKPPTTAKPTAPPTSTKPISNSGGSNGGSNVGSSSNGWKLTFEDDFNSFNGNDWGIYEGRGNEGVGRRARSAVNVNDGKLKITGKGDVAGGVALRGGGQTYGKWEVRARLSKGSGYNSAILLWPTSERWPVDGEIDISEIFSGNYDQSCSFTHWGKNNSQKGECQDLDTSDWHTYGVEWTSGKINYLIDGKVHHSIAQGEAVPDNDHFLGLQLDVAKSGGRVSGTSLEVDWVKVYKKA